MSPSEDFAAAADWARLFPGAIIGPYRDKAPRIARDAFIAPGAVVIGDVEVGAAVNIWYGCVLRGDDHWIRIGARSNIQDGTVVHVTLDEHPTEIGAEVTVGHGARLHGCRIGDGSLIGIGAVVLDGAVVEGGALVAAGALVAPRKHVGRGELWAGNPARRLRDLSSEELGFIAFDSRHYVKLSGDHRELVLGRKLTGLSPAARPDRPSAGKP